MGRSIILWLCFWVLFTQCEPVPGAEELNQNLVVQTNYDATANFNSYSTYTLTLDTLGLISDNPADTLIVGDYAHSVTSVIKANMDSRGYTYVDKSQSPDLGFNAFIVNDFNVYQSISYPRYGGGYYSPYYGYYYPVVNTYAFNSAVLILQLVDFNQLDSKGQFKVIWTSNIGDVISSIDPFQKSVEAVDQAFVQSPVIQK